MCNVKNQGLVREGITDPFSLPVIELGRLDLDAFVAFYREHKDEIDRKLLLFGALKLSGVEIGSPDIFQRVVDSISVKFMNYIDGNSPRTKLTGAVYTSTEYDASQRITMHNELSYSAKWPNRLFLTCLQPAVEGGETLLADSRAILKRMNKEIVSEVRKRGVCYIRNLHGGGGIGQSWQETFETGDKEVMEEYCRSYGIELEWKEGDMLRLKQFSKGIIRHRQSGEEVWFNQIDQFHPIQLGEEVYEAMLTMFETPDEFPIYVTFGDGGTIESSMVKEIIDTIDKLTAAPVWDRNELLIVDNELVCHGRNSFKGDRRVLVAMSE